VLCSASSRLASQSPAWQRQQRTCINKTGSKLKEKSSSKASKASDTRFRGKTGGNKHCIELSQAKTLPLELSCKTSTAMLETEVHANHDPPAPSLVTTQASYAGLFYLPGLRGGLSLGERTKFAIGGRAPARGDVNWLLTDGWAGDPVPALGDFGVAVQRPNGGRRDFDGLAGSGRDASIRFSSSFDFLAFHPSVLASKKSKTVCLCSINMSVIVSCELMCTLPNRFRCFLATSLDQKLCAGVAKTKDKLKYQGASVSLVEDLQDINGTSSMKETAPISCSCTRPSFALMKLMMAPWPMFVPIRITCVDSFSSM
jgi:hypothetical protein